MDTQHPIIEPCCFNRQLDELVNTIEGQGKAEVAHFFTFGDLALPHFIDYFIRHAPGCEVFLALLTVTEQTVSHLARQLEKKHNGEPLVNHLTLLTQGTERKRIAEALGTFIEQGRVTVCEDRTAFRCLAVRNTKHCFVLNGSINQANDYAMQMFTLTTGRKTGDTVMRIFATKEKVKSTKI